MCEPQKSPKQPKLQIFGIPLSFTVFTGFLTLTEAWLLLLWMPETRTARKHGKQDVLLLE